VRFPRGLAGVAVLAVLAGIEALPASFQRSIHRSERGAGSYDPEKHARLSNHYNTTPRPWRTWPGCQRKGA